MTTKPAAHARHRVKRIPARANYERAAAYAILDQSWIAHVSFVARGQPFVIPMLYARDGDSLLLHGSVASRIQQSLAEGIEACVCVTLLDGLVLARSHFHHSVNYRSVVAFGRAVVIEDGAEKAAALYRFVDALLPGRAADARPADRKELNATSVLRFAIADVSAKVREGGPKDDSDDLVLPVWAGVIPMAQRYATPQPASDLDLNVKLPAYLASDSFRG